MLNILADRLDGLPFFFHFHGENYSFLRDIFYYLRR